MDFKKHRPSLDQYFMKIAVIVSERSTCFRKAVGAVIVKNKQIVSTGYNGAPAGLPDCFDNRGCLRDILKIESGRDKTVCLAAHAEKNAIAFAARYGISIEGSTMYVTYAPCYDCAKMIINAGISKVYYKESHDESAGINLLLESTQVTVKQIDEVEKR